MCVSQFRIYIRKKWKRVKNQYHHSELIIVNIFVKLVEIWVLRPGKIIGAELETNLKEVPCTSSTFAVCLSMYLSIYICVYLLSISIIYLVIYYQSSKWF